jgi:hypothetical protein
VGKGVFLIFSSKKWFFLEKVDFPTCTALLFVNKRLSELVKAHVGRKCLLLQLSVLEVEGFEFTYDAPRFCSSFNPKVYYQIKEDGKELKLLRTGHGVWVVDNLRANQNILRSCPKVTVELRATCLNHNGTRTVSYQFKTKGSGDLEHHCSCQKSSFIVSNDLRVRQLPLMCCDYIAAKN